MEGGKTIGPLGVKFHEMKRSWRLRKAKPDNRGTMDFQCLKFLLEMRKKMKIHFTTPSSLFSIMYLLYITP